MRRRQVGIVVDRDRVLAEAARRLDHQHHMAEPQAGEHDVAGAFWGFVGVQLTRRGAPVFADGRGQFVRHILKETEVGGQRDPGRGRAELVFCEPLDVVAAGRDQRVDQRVAVLGEALAEVVAGVAHGSQQRHGRRRGVQADRVAHPGVLGGIGGEHDGDALGGVRGGGQASVPDGDAGQPGGPLGIGGVAGYPVRALLLERERHGDQAAVELGNRHLHRGVDRGQRGVRGRPLRARAGQAQALQHRHVQAGQHARVPVALAGRVRTAMTRGRAAGREHRGDHRAGRGEQVGERGVSPSRRAPFQRVTAERAAEDGEGSGAVFGQGGAEGVHEGGVPGQFVRAVEHDGHHRAVGGCGPGQLVDPVGGHRARGVEALAGEEDGVGQEAGQLTQVLRAAFAQVAQSFGGHARGHGGQRHQLGVRGGLAAQGNERPVRWSGGGQRGGERGHALGPGLPAAEEPEHHEVGPGRQPGHVVRRDPGRVDGQVSGAGGRGREQFGVGGGNQENGEHSPILPCRATANSWSTHRWRTG